MRGLLRSLYKAVSRTLGGKRFVEPVGPETDPAGTADDLRNISILPEPPLRVAHRTAAGRRERLLVDLLSPERARINRVGRDARWRTRHRWTARHLSVEQLEKRVMLAVDVWSGGNVSVDENWSDPKNWQSGVAPQADDNLVFPAGPTGTALTSNNDFAAGTRFRAITISAAGYDITGTNGLSLIEGITSNFTGAGTSSIIDIPSITLAASQTIYNANAGTTLIINSNLDTGNLLLLTVDGWETRRSAEWSVTRGASRKMAPAR